MDISTVLVMPIWGRYNIKQVLGSSTWRYPKIIIPTVESLIALYGQLMCLLNTKTAKSIDQVLRDSWSKMWPESTGEVVEEEPVEEEPIDLYTKWENIVNSLNCRHMRSWSPTQMIFQTHSNERHTHLIMQK